MVGYLPIKRTRCIEVSALRCTVLKTRGFDTVQANFLDWAATTAERFSRVVMNPPFGEGRWRAHVKVAASLVHAGGRLVAVLPASARNRVELVGFNCEWSSVYSNEFAGTSVSVALLMATKTS